MYIYTCIIYMRYDTYVMYICIPDHLPTPIPSPSLATKENNGATSCASLGDSAAAKLPSVSSETWGYEDMSHEKRVSIIKYLFNEYK